MLIYQIDYTGKHTFNSVLSEYKRANTYISHKKLNRKFWLYEVDSAGLASYENYQVTDSGTLVGIYCDSFFINHMLRENTYFCLSYYPDNKSKECHYKVLDYYKIPDVSISNIINTLDDLPFLYSYKKFIKIGKYMLSINNFYYNIVGNVEIWTPYPTKMFDKSFLLIKYLDVDNNSRLADSIGNGMAGLTEKLYLEDNTVEVKQWNFVDEKNSSLFWKTKILSTSNDL